MNFLQELLDSTMELEPPVSFWYWSGLATISAILMDNVWLPRGQVEGNCNAYYNLYPNIYVMLHADSGLKKGPPVSLAKDLVKKVNNTRIISGRSSIQGMLKELGTAYTLPGGVVIKKSTAFIAASEFSSSIVEDKAAMTILTDLYDRQYNAGDWKSLLKMEQFSLTDPTVTLLVATNEAHFDDFIGLKDVHGGFIARMFVIAEKESALLNPLIHELKRVPDRIKLSNYLKEVAKLKGPFETLNGTPAGELYHEWYMDFYKNIKDQKIKDDTGTIQRFGDSVLKVAMLIALSSKPELIIDLTTMEEAINQCNKLIGNVRKTTIGKKGKAVNLQFKTIIMEELLNREPHMISRTQLMKKYWMHYSSAEEFTGVMNSFHESGLILTENRGNTVVYIMEDGQVEKLREFLAGRKGEG